MRRIEILQRIPELRPDDLVNWERLGYLKPWVERRGKKGLRNYSVDDLRLIKGLVLFRSLGITLRQAHEWMSSNSTFVSIFILVGGVARARSAEIVRGLRSLEATGLEFKAIHAVYGGLDVICEMSVPAIEAYGLLWGRILEKIGEAGKVTVLPTRGEGG